MFEQTLQHHEQCVPPLGSKPQAVCLMIAIPLLLQVNEHATPKGNKLSCNVDAEAECGEEPTGLADPTPDSTEASPTPLSGWEDENCPVPVSPASSMDCMSCSHIWCFAYHVCPFQHSRLCWLSHLHPLAMCEADEDNFSATHHLLSPQYALQCTTLHTQSLLVVRSGRWFDAEHVQVVGAAIR